VSAFGFRSGHPEAEAKDDAIRRAAERIAQQADLEQPVKVLHFEITHKNELAIELVDFMGMLSRQS
jgi:hypothetical protein